MEKGRTEAFPATDLSLDKSWGPSGGLRQRKGRCNEPRRPPLPRSPREVEEEGERAPQTHRYPPGEAEEAGRGCLLLGGDGKRKDKNPALRTLGHQNNWTTLFRHRITISHSFQFSCPRCSIQGYLLLWTCLLMPIQFSHWNYFTFSMKLKLPFCRRM